MAKQGKRTAATIPVVEERLAIGKRAVSTGSVRVHTAVDEREQTFDVPLEEEEVRVDRVPVGRPVDAIVPPRYEGETLVIPVFEEAVSVHRQLVLKEEVRVTKVRRVRREQGSVRLRRERAEVTRVEREPQGDAPSARRARGSAR